MSHEYVKPAFKPRSTFASTHRGSLPIRAILPLYARGAVASHLPPSRLTFGFGSCSHLYKVRRRLFVRQSFYRARYLLRKSFGDRLKFCERREREGNEDSSLDSGLVEPRAAARQIIRLKLVQAKLAVLHAQLQLLIPISPYKKEKNGGPLERFSVSSGRIRQRAPQFWID